MGNNIEAEVTKFLPESNKEPIREKKHILKCNSCLTKLIEIVEILDIEYNQSIKAKCFCGGSSFVLKTSGKTLTKPLNCTILSIDYPYNPNDYTVIQCKK
jgi:hypothetical protein